MSQAKAKLNRNGPPKNTRPLDCITDPTETSGDENSDGLKPEMKLERLGYCMNGEIDYNRITLPCKSNLYEELHKRISNYTNTDVEVIIGQEEFSCHSMVLETYSEYFINLRALKKFELPEDQVTSNSFITIYDWMISGEDCIQLLKRENILEVFIAAQYLKIKELEDQCWSFIDSEEVFVEDSAFLIYMDAKKKGLEAVKELMLPRIKKFFLMLVSSQDFVELDLDEVCALLQSNYIVINCEMEVLMSAVRWLKYDWNNRVSHIIKVLGCVRFGLIAPWLLVDIKRNPENPELMDILNIPEICKMVDDGLSFVIINHWYGQQSEEYRHWIQLLGLEEPITRNWSGVTKNYITYCQFLEFLDVYRQESLLEKNKAVTKSSECINLNSKLSQRFSEPIISTREISRRKEFPYKDKTSDESMMTSTSDDGAVKKLPSIYKEFLVKKPVQDQLPPKVHNSKDYILKHVHKKNLPHSQNVQALYTMKNNALANNDNLEPKTFLLDKQKFLTKDSLFSNDRECILIFGGLDPHSPLGFNRNTAKDIYRYIPETNSWNFVGELPSPRCYHSTVFYNGRVYLAGGNVPLETGSKNKCSIRNTVWSFNPVTREWFDECPLITPRKYFAFVVSNSKIFAIGGEGPQGIVLSSVERYEQGGKWEEVAPMRQPRTGLCCTKYNDLIWVAGGVTGSRRNPISDSVECYNTKLNEWTKIKNMRFPRSYATLFTMHDKMYLIGGVGKVLDMQVNSVGAIDVWDSKDKQWKLKTELAVPRHGHAIAYLGTQILVIGGVTTVYMRALSSAECYCCERNTWVRGVAPTPIMLSGHSAVTLPPVSLL